MRNYINRFLCLALTMALLLTLLPAPARAETEETAHPETVPTETTDSLRSDPEALSAAGSIAVDEMNFPDANFRNYILNQSYGEDGLLTGEELGSVTVISVSNSNIGSLKGIEYFTALNTLLCDSNQLTSLDVSNNSNLSSFSCCENTYTITVDSQRQFDLNSLPGSFDVSRASDWNGGTVDGTVLTAQENTVTYTYKVSDSRTAAFKIIVNTYDVLTKFPVDEVSFPDANIRSYILNQSCGRTGWLTEAERDGVTGIERNNGSLMGIESFTDLINLFVMTTN